MLKKTIKLFAIFAGLCVIITIIDIIALAIFPISIVGVDTDFDSTSTVFSMEADKVYIFNVIGTGHAYGYTTGRVILYSGFEEVYSFYIDHYFDGDSDYSSSLIGFYTPPKTTDNYYFVYDAGNTVTYGAVDLELQESLFQSLFDINDFWFIIIMAILGIVCIIIAIIAPKLAMSTIDTKELSRERELESKYERVPCPNCGLMTDGNYCEECGTDLREKYRDF